MARKSEQYTIDGLQFRSRQLGAIEGRRLLALLIPAVSPALGKLDSAALANAKGGEKLLAIIAGAAEGLTPELVDTVCAAFAGQTQYLLEGRWLEFGPLFDDELAGRYGTMIRWLSWNLKFNFADFLEQRAPTSGANPAGPAAK